jgi:hypothetical protein
MTEQRKVDFSSLMMASDISEVQEVRLKYTLIEEEVEMEMEA